MIVGRGLLASAFAPRYAADPTVIIFASGVSNSRETNPIAFARERDLLQPLLEAGKRVVYFGSCGSASGDSSADTPYMRHKRAMEELVTSSADGLVLRLPQVVGRTSNPNTLTNFVRDRIVGGVPFTVWAQAERNLIDIDDVAAIGSRLIDDANGAQRVLSIAAAKSLPMPDVIAIFERVLGRRARVTFEPLGNPLSIDAAEALAVARQLGIDFGEDYAETLIRKYYAPDT